MDNRFSPATEDVLHEELENMRILFEDEELFTQAMNLAKKENPPTPTSPLTCTDESSSVPDIEELPPLPPSPTLELQEEVESLKTQLVQAHTSIKTLQSHIVKQKVKNNHVVSALMMQLKHNEEQLRLQRVKSDSQLGEVMTHLLFLEGRMKKEQQHIKCAMKEKDKTINTQKEQIEKLTLTNDRLLEAVREAYARKGKNGLIFDFEFDGEDGLPDSPNEKSPPGSGKSTPRKGRFGSMKDIMKRHRSSLDLSDTDLEITKGLVKNNRQYSSSENLLMISRKNKNAREVREKKCKSIAGYPDGSLSNFIMEVPDEGELRLDNSSHSKMFSVNDENQNRIGKSGSSVHTVNGHSINGLAESPALLLTATSMPILSQNDASLTPEKTRPKSISSIEHLSPEEREAQNDNGPLKSPGANSNSSFIDSNPFKNLKTILKRKGSKMKSKKRTVTMADSSNNQEHQDAIRKHFEKFDMT